MTTWKHLAFALPLLPLVTASCAPANGGEPERVRRASEAIIGGEPDTGLQAHESVVLLAIPAGLCSGSLLAPNLVLTARHCVSQMITDQVACDLNGHSSNGDQVAADFAPSALGVHTGQSPNLGGAPVTVGKKIFHPAGFDLCNRDIALVLLESAVAGAVPMKVRLDFPAQIGELATVVGYGKTTNDNASAGSRYRRANVPILSVSRDDNYFLGENEILMGQSVCQGDSGGPAMVTDTEAIVGVTSRGADCFTGHQRFTRVDAYKTLVLQALSEAGAQAALEGKPVPAPVTPTPTGQGPCTTGAQCKQDFCFPDVPGGMCSLLGCAPGFCANPLLCVPATVTIDDVVQASPIPVCQPHAPVDACDTCRFAKCKAKVETCEQNADGAAMFACVEPCTTLACYDACAAAHPEGAGVYQAARDCECSTKCDKPCAGVCGKESGSGGSGGAGGFGSAGSGGSAGAGGAAGGAAGAGGQASAGGAPGSGGGTAAGGSPPSTKPASQPAPSASDGGGCDVSGGGASSSPGDAWRAWLAFTLGLAASRRRSRRAFAIAAAAARSAH